MNVKEVRNMDSIAGYEFEKRELMKLIKLFKNYDEYEKKGIKIPRGLILQGPPGTGKTLMASALANVCDVPFFMLDDSIGDSCESETLSNLKKLFDEAEKKTPSIVYIDEIDSITSSFELTTDETERITKFLLTKLDGCSDSDKQVMVIASTNSYHDLPDALIRSGRFDKQIRIDLPTIRDREKILALYMKGHSMFDGINLHNLALRIRGLSGADIKTLVNNALIEYVDEKTSLTVDDFDKLINQIQFGTIGKTWAGKESSLKVLAHEVGHALIMKFVAHKNCSIAAIKYGDLGGFTKEESVEYETVNTKDVPVPIDWPESPDSEESSSQMTKINYLNDICVDFGGKAGEKVFLGDYANGVGSDMTNAISAVYSMATNGMLGNWLIGANNIAYESELTKLKFERTRKRIFDKQYARAIKTIKKHKNLGKFIISKAFDNDCVLSVTELNSVIKEYDENKTKIDAYMKYVDVMDLGSDR